MHISSPKPELGESGLPCQCEAGRPCHVSFNERYLDMWTTEEAEDHSRLQVQIGTYWTVDALKLPPHNDFWKKWEAPFMPRAM